MQLWDRFEVLSKDPLWTFGWNNEPVLIQNTFNNLEIIKCYPYGREYKYCVEIPIEDPITPFFPYGTFFFKTESQCAKYKDYVNTLEGQQTLLENAFSASRNNKIITKFKLDPCDDEEIENGIYSIKDFDELLSDSTILNRYLCYVDCEENEIRKINPANTTLEKYLRDYCKMFDLVKNRNFVWERLVFEIYKEDGNLYINHLFLQSDISKIMSDVFVCTRIMNYPICPTELDARRVRILNQFDAPITKIMDDAQRSIVSDKKYIAEKERKRRLINKILKMCAETLWNHKGTIISGLKTLI